MNFDNKKYTLSIDSNKDKDAHPLSFSSEIPYIGIGDEKAYRLISEKIINESALLGAPDAYAHMDPHPSSIAAKLVGLNAKYNQNLLHPDLSPFATYAEEVVIDWLKPFFGMSTGHMCAGSTLANLTALWAARENGAVKVITSTDAHISVPKSASILNLPVEFVPTDSNGRIKADCIDDFEKSAVVFTAGTTGRGAIDPLAFFANKIKKPLWLHVDAAWAGPLRLTSFKERLDGIETADSVCISAHKWLFQPKDSALILFKDPSAQDAISYGSSYLASPNIGVQGSRSAAAVALLGTIMSLGIDGLNENIGNCIEMSEELSRRVANDKRVELLQFPESGVINWRPVSAASEGAENKTRQIVNFLGRTASSTKINNELWARQVSTNVNADIELIWSKIDAALDL